MSPHPAIFVAMFALLIKNALSGLVETFRRFAGSQRQTAHDFHIHTIIRWPPTVLEDVL